MRTPRRVLAVAAATLLVASAAMAAWQPSGVPLCGVCGEFRDPGATSDGAGGMYGVTFDGSHVTGVRHLSSTGDDAPGWGLAGAIVTTLFSMTRAPRLAPDGTGGVFVGFLATGCVASCTQFDPGLVMVQHFLSNGARPGLWSAAGLPVDTVKYDPQGETADPPVLAFDGAGGVLVAWTTVVFSRTGYEPGQVVVQRFDANGARPWTASAQGLLVAPGSTGRQFAEGIVPDGSGGALVVWTDRRDSPAVSKIYLQHLAADGSLANASGTPLVASVFPQGAPQILADDAGGAFVAWFDTTTSTTLALRAQHLDASGAPTWGTVATIATGIAMTTGNARVISKLALAPDGAGGFFAAWTDVRAGRMATCASRLDGSGQLVAPWPAGGLVTNDDPSGQFTPLVATDGAGGVYVSWIGAAMSATHLNGDGSRAAGWPSTGTPLCHDGPSACQFTEWAPAYLVADGRGGAIGAWLANRNVPYPIGVDHEQSFAQRIQGDGPTAALASLIFAETEGGRVRVEWWTTATGALSVERATGAASAGWSPIGAVTPDAEHHVTITDAGVQPGRRYGYRLVRSANGASESLDETWIDVPSSAALFIAGARPNPAPGNLRVAFQLPSGAPATMDVMDAAGRRMLSERTDGLGAGTHVMEFMGSASLPAGVYLVRLSQAGRVAARRICLLR